MKYSLIFILLINSVLHGNNGKRYSEEKAILNSSIFVPKEFTINLDLNCTIYGASPSSHTLSSTGGTVTSSVIYSSGGCNPYLYFTNVPSWLTVYKNGSVIQITAGSYSGSTDRTASFGFHSGNPSTSRTIYVTQQSPATAPPTPSHPAITNNCGNTVLTRGNPPTGVTWYWQSTSTGTSTANSAVSITRTSGTVYYLRARNNSGGLWSTSSRIINYSINQPSVWYADLDGDLLGDPNMTITDCIQPDNYVDNNLDQCPDNYGTDNGCPADDSPPYVSHSFSNKNYIFSRSYQKPLYNSSELENVSNVIESITYFDGLGRKVQGIGIRASDEYKDVITQFQYDGYGRMEKDWLPMANIDANNATYRGDISSSISNFYLNRNPEDLNINSPNPFGQKQFESSPLNRVQKQAAPGYDWRIGGGHEIELNDNTNIANEVKCFSVDLTTGSPVLAGGGSSVYLPGTLHKSIMSNENHVSGLKNTSEEFKDIQGRLVLKRTYADSDLNMNGIIESNELNIEHDTYYVYDDYGNLTFVLPPKMYASNETLSNLKLRLSDLGYQYKYDNRDRLVEKRIPGKGWEYIIYNKLDQPIMAQDANLRTQNKWLFTKYDAFGRIVYTGLLVRNASRLTIQSEADNITTYPNQYEKVSTSSNLGGGSISYTNNAYPSNIINSNNNITEIHTVNYFDSYTDTAGMNVPSMVFSVSTNVDTKTLPTVKKVRVLGTTSWITTIFGYDDKGRMIYSKNNNPYLTTTDEIELKLDFVGKVVESKSIHSKTNPNLTITTQDFFFYDHLGRLKKQTQKINGGTEELIVANEYDALGQLKQKKVGGAPALDGLQTINYKHNIRGWLKMINNPDALGDDLFAFKLNYNTTEMSAGATGLFNGNISETIWRTANTGTYGNRKRGYAFEYDALNRMTGGTFRRGNSAGSAFNEELDSYNVTGIVYDLNGNINRLNRKGYIESTGTIGDLDKLVYDYFPNTNKLRSLDEGGGSVTSGFKDPVNVAQEYFYDTNGNMERDLNKNIGTSTKGIVYNHLNLPTEVKFADNNNKKINYVYTANGRKLRKTVTDNSSLKTTDYAGNFVYSKFNANATELNFFNQPEGYIKPKNPTNLSSGFEYYYQYKDHLGNNRLSYKNTAAYGAPKNLAIQEENNYYPYGLSHKGYNINTENHIFKYNDTELEASLGLNMYEMDFRHYDPEIGRFTGIDPVTHHSMSPYMAFDGNPVFWSDPSGADAVGADGLTNDQWMQLSRPGGGGSDAMRAQARANSADIAAKNYADSKKNTISSGPLEELDSELEKFRAVMSAYNQILLSTAYNNAILKVFSGDESKIRQYHISTKLDLSEVNKIVGKQTSHLHSSSIEFDNMYDVVSLKGDNNSFILYAKPNELSFVSNGIVGTFEGEDVYNLNKTWGLNQDTYTAGWYPVSFHKDRGAQGYGLNFIGFKTNEGRMEFNNYWKNIESIFIQAFSN